MTVDDEKLNDAVARWIRDHTDGLIEHDMPVHLRLRIKQCDIDFAKHRNTSFCVQALGIRRQEGLDRKARVWVDARVVRFPMGDFNYHYQPSAPMVADIRKFDDIGRKHGVAKARAAMRPTTYVLMLVKRVPRKRMTEDQRLRDNAKRAERRARQIAEGRTRDPAQKYLRSASVGM